MSTYNFTVVLQQDGATEAEAWNSLLTDIADAPRECIDAYQSAVVIDGSETNAARVERMIDGEYTNDTEDNIPLILADIRLLCDKRDWDFAALDQEARNIYLGELDKKGQP